MALLPDLFPDARIEFVGAFESTYQPAHDSDVFETTEHVRRRADDLALLDACGVRWLRYPVRWHRTEQTPGQYDWSDTDAAFDALAARGMRPIVDLVHHTSYPQWLSRGFADERFPRAYVDYCVRFAERYPDVEAYTLFNEPLPTLFLCGHEGLWPPYDVGIDAFVSLLTNVVPAIAEAASAVKELLPGAAHVYVDTCEHHSSDHSPGPARHAEMANGRRFFVLDALLGRADPDTIFGRAALESGGDVLFRLPPIAVDILGLDYYPHGEWWYAENRYVSPSPQPIGLAAVAAQYADRYDLPLMLGETNIRGFASDRASWLKYALEQCEQLRAAGYQLGSFCWFPFIDSCDWGSLLDRCEGRVDPVGVVWLDRDYERRLSTMTMSYARAAAGARAAELPAYRFRPPVNRWLEGWAPQMSHWDWVDPPSGEIDDPDDHDAEMELRICEPTA